MVNSLVAEDLSLYHRHTALYRNRGRFQIEHACIMSHSTTPSALPMSI